MTETDKKTEFDEKKKLLENKIRELIQNKDLKSIKNSIISLLASNSNIKSRNNSSDNYSNFLANKINDDNDIVKVIEELLLYHGNDLSKSIRKAIFSEGVDELESITNDLRNIINYNNEKINQLIKKFIKEDQQSDSSSNEGQSNMADSFKEEFGHYIINKSEEDEYDSWYLKYLNGKIQKDNLNSNEQLSNKEVFLIRDILFDNKAAPETMIGLNKKSLREKSGHYILTFNGKDFDDSFGAGVQVDNCCGVYASHMYYIAEKIYFKMINKGMTVNFDAFKEIYNKYKNIYVENAQKSDLKIMKKINYKNRLCIAAERSLDILDGYIDIEIHNNLMGDIKEAIEKSFITEQMKVEIDKMDKYIETEVKKEKLKYMKQYFLELENNDEDENIKKIKNGHYERKLEEIKSITNSDDNEGKINDLIEKGEISNKKIIKLINNNNLNKNNYLSEENFLNAILPTIKLNNKDYSGFNGKINYNNKIFTIKYDKNGFFNDKLNLIDNLDEKLKENIKKGIKIKIKGEPNNKEIIEIFTLFKTNPILAILKLKEISEEIYFGDDNTTKVGDKDFKNLAYAFSTISEARREVVKLNKIIDKQNNQTSKVETTTDSVIYSNIETFMCSYLKEALMNNDKAKEIINLTNFKDITIIINQSLDLFKKLENNNDIFSNNEDVYRDLINKFRDNTSGEKDKITVFMNCFNAFMSYKLQKAEEEINREERQEQQQINN